MRWQYSKSSLFSPITEFAILHNYFMGSLHCAICLGVTVYVVPVSFGVWVYFSIPKSVDTMYCGLYMSTYDSIASCMMLLDADLGVRLMNQSLSWEM